jgi:hypothetical protein
VDAVAELELATRCKGFGGGAESPELEPIGGLPIEHDELVVGAVAALLPLSDRLQCGALRCYVCQQQLVASGFEPSELDPTVEGGLPGLLLQEVQRTTAPLGAQAELPCRNTKPEQALPHSMSAAQPQFPIQPGVPLQAAVPDKLDDPFGIEP